MTLKKLTEAKNYNDKIIKAKIISAEGSVPRNQGTFMLISKNLKQKMNLINKLGGFLLLLTGILILTNQLQAVGFYILNYLPFLQKIG